MIMILLQSKIVKNPTKVLKKEKVSESEEEKLKQSVDETKSKKKMIL